MKNSGMRAGWRRTAGTIFDQHTLDTFARHIWQSVLVDDRDLWTFVSGYPRAHANCGHQCANSKCQCSSPTDSEVRIRFIVMFFSVMSVWFFFRC